MKSLNYTWVISFMQIPLPFANTINVIRLQYFVSASSQSVARIEECCGSKKY